MQSDMIATLGCFSSLNTVDHILCAMQRFLPFADVQQAACSALLRILEQEHTQEVHETNDQQYAYVPGACAVMVASGALTCIINALERFGKFAQCELLWEAMYALCESGSKIASEPIFANVVHRLVLCMNNLPLSDFAYKYGCPILRRLAHSDIAKAALVDYGAITFILHIIRCPGKQGRRQLYLEAISTLTALSCVLTRRVTTSPSFTHFVTSMMCWHHGNMTIQLISLQYIAACIHCPALNAILHLVRKTMNRCIENAAIQEQGCMILYRASTHRSSLEMCDCNARRLLCAVMRHHPQREDLHAICWHTISNSIDSHCCGRLACGKLLFQAAKTLTDNSSSKAVLQYVLQTLAGCMYSDDFVAVLTNGSLSSVLRLLLELEVDAILAKHGSEFIARMVWEPHTCVLLRSLGGFELLRRFVLAFADASEILKIATMGCAMYSESASDIAVVIGYQSSERSCSICFMDITAETGTWCPHCIQGSTGDRQGFHFMCWNTWGPTCPMCRQTVSFLYPRFTNELDMKL